MITVPVSLLVRRMLAFVHAMVVQTHRGRRQVMASLVRVFVSGFLGSPIQRLDCSGSLANALDVAMGAERARDALSVTRGPDVPSFLVLEGTRKNIFPWAGFVGTWLAAVSLQESEAGNRTRLLEAV